MVFSLVMTFIKTISYGLWQSESHQLAISYERGGEGSKIDWEIVQDGNVLIKNARIDEIERFNGRYPH